jgi:hypothetical protein
MGKVFRKLRKKYRKYYRALFLSASAIVFFGLLFLLFWQMGTVPEHYVYISSENLKQGETALIKVSGKYPAVSGFFDNKSIVFFRNGKYSDWSAFLGIDAGMEPGEYEIFINAFGEKMEKEINVAKKDFPSAKMIIAKEIIQSIRKNDNPALSQVFEKFTPEAYFDGPFSFPLGNMQKSGFDFGEFIKNGNSQIQHLGIDLRALEKTKIYAANNGKVVLAKDLPEYGKIVIIDHGAGIFSLYLHLYEFNVSLDEQVKKGQQIGLSGNTGYSAAPHLHFSIRDNGARIDPILFIEKTKEINENYGLASIGRAFSKFFKGLFSVRF